MASETNPWWNGDLRYNQDHVALTGNPDAAVQRANIFKAPELTKPAFVPNVSQPWKGVTGKDVAGAYTSDAVKASLAGQQTVQRGTSEKKSFSPIDEKSSSDGINALLGLYTSPDEERRLREASVQRQRITAVADALRQIGNIYHTTKYAPSQQFNNPVMEERQRYLQEKQLRDSNNLKFMSYQQAKAAQDAQMRRLENQAAYNEMMMQWRADQLQRQKDNDAANQAYKERKLEADNAYKQRRADTAAYSAETSRIKATKGRSGGGGKGSGGDKYWFYDENGKYHGYKNKTMYEQGVEEYGGNVSHTAQYSGYDSKGNKVTKTTQAKPTQIGGRLNQKAKQNANKKKTGIDWGGKSSKQGKGKKSAGNINWQ